MKTLTAYPMYRTIEVDGAKLAITARELVMEAMHHSGRLVAAGKVPGALWSKLYLMADGFGRLTASQAEAQAWDWSHVRDASDEAYERMADAIEAALK